jgi:hypothetical protein
MVFRFLSLVPYVSVMVLAMTGCRSNAKNPKSHQAEAYQTSEFSSFFSSDPKHIIEFSQLTTNAQLQSRGWPSYYWPSFRWGLLATTFDQSLSPLQKFEKVYGKALSGLNSQYTQGDLERFERQRVLGSTTNWFGVCDGSAESSLSFAEPRGVKTIDGVVFYPSEIKALLSYFTAMSSPSRKLLMTGIRVHYDVPDVDQTGRPVGLEYRDINPGLFHLALGNFIGRTKIGLVADIVPGSIVLNFPIIGFKVLSSRLIQRGSDNNEEQRPPVSSHNPNAESVVQLKVEVVFGDSHRVLETFPNVDHSIKKTYEYELELDGKGRIIGGEWLGSSRRDHPDFLWLSDEDLNIESFETDRLNGRLLVGPALVSLLNEPTDENSEAVLQLLRLHPDTLLGFRIFENDDAAGLLPPPHDETMKKILLNSP